MLSIGIVGLPNVGKSTLFKALTKKQVDISNYPFTTIEFNVGVVAVPDERLELLAKMSGSQKVIPTAIEFIDIAGLVKGAAQGEGLGNRFLAHIREVDAIAEVVRVFEDESVAHVHKKIDPADDIEIIKVELELADLETNEKRETKKVKKDKDGGRAPSNLLTDKKTIYVFNVSERQLKDGWRPDEKIRKAIGPSEYVVLSVTFELLLSESNPEEQKVFLEEVGFKTNGLDAVIKKAYQVLDMITFFTIAGGKETRAWTTKRGNLIPQAARAIHSDFEQHFIRAEVINWQELLNAGSWSTARQTGKIHTVGKDYVVQDGDVVEIKI